MFERPKKSVAGGGALRCNFAHTHALSWPCAEGRRRRDGDRKLKLKGPTGTRKMTPHHSSGRRQNRISVMASWEGRVRSGSGCQEEHQSPLHCPPKRGAGRQSSLGQEIWAVTTHKSQLALGVRSNCNLLKIMSSKFLPENISQAKSPENCSRPRASLQFL